MLTTCCRDDTINGMTVLTQAQKISYIADYPTNVVSFEDQSAVRESVALYLAAKEGKTAEALSAEGFDPDNAEVFEKEYVELLHKILEDAFNAKSDEGVKFWIKLFPQPVHTEAPSDG